MAGAPTAIPSLDSTMGALYVGVIIATALWGVSCVQLFSYFTSNSKDGWGLKSLVIVAFASDTIHQMLICHVAYWYLITNYFNPVHLGTVVWSIIVEVLFNAITAFIVQCFFCYRVYKLSRQNYAITGVIGTLVVVNFGLLLWYVVQAVPMTNYAQIATLRHLDLSINTLTVVTDSLIAFVLCLMLHTSRTGFKQSETMINRLMVFAVNTGLLTSVCSILALATNQGLPNTFIYICFWFALGRLYINSLLATLNARRYIRDLSEGTSQDVSIPLSNGGPAASRQQGRSRQSQTSPNIAIKIDTSKQSSRDLDEHSQDDKVAYAYSPQPGDADVIPYKA